MANIRKSMKLQIVSYVITLFVHQVTKVILN